MGTALAALSHSAAPSARSSTTPDHSTLWRLRRSGEHTAEPPPPRSTLFPYTTLFRSRRRRRWAQLLPPCRTAPLHRLAARRRRIIQLCGGSGDRESTRLNPRHRDLHSFPTRRSSDLVGVGDGHSSCRPVAQRRSIGSQLDDAGSFNSVAAPGMGKTHGLNPVTRTD